MEAELETDWTTVLHMTHNRQVSLEQIKHPAVAAGLGVSSDVAGSDAPLSNEGMEQVACTEGTAAQCGPACSMETSGGGAVFRFDPARLQSQVLSERTAVANAQRTQLYHLRTEIDARLEPLDAASRQPESHQTHWLLCTGKSCRGCRRNKPTFYGTDCSPTPRSPSARTSSRRVLPAVAPPCASFAG